jgi:hypothetical protein
MIGAGVVEVDRSLDQPQTEGAGVEVEVAAGIAGDGGDVVEAEDPGRLLAHGALGM